jgi:predicted PurR-regulated permease PerM
MVLMLLMTTFLLLESGGFEDKLSRVLGDRGELLERYSRISEEVQRYLWIKSLISLATGIFIGVWVAVVGLDFPLLWGFVAFLLNYIPNIGSILAAVPAMGLAIIQLGAAGALLVLLGYVLTNILWGSLVEPQVLGRRLRLSPLAVFLSLVFWGWVWGPLGMILSVPITMVLKIAMENSVELRKVAALLDPPARSGSG